jgi:hypothetical protein
LRCIGARIGPKVRGLLGEDLAAIQAAEEEMGVYRVVG